MTTVLQKCLLRFGSALMLVSLLAVAGTLLAPKTSAASGSTITLFASTTTPAPGTRAALTALVADAHEQPIPGVDVAFAIISGLSSIGGAVHATTDSHGLASSGISVSSPGTSAVLQASFTDGAGATQSSNQVQITWSNESSITLTAATTSPAQGTPLTLIATAAGINGQPAVGATVTFSVASGPDVGATVTSTTDSTGVATGSFTSAVSGAVDNFNARFTDSSGATQISKLLQVNWRASPGIVLDAPTTTPALGDRVTLTATVTGANGQPSPGVDVTFAVVSGFPPSPSDVTTDNNGLATYTIGTNIPGSSAGIQASFADGTQVANQVQLTWIDKSAISANISATNRLPGATVLVRATVLDVHGQPAPSVGVSFAAISGPDTGLTGTATTDVNGAALFSFTDPSTPGTDVIQASFADAVTPLTITSNQVQVIWQRLTATGQAISATEGSQFSSTLATITGAVDVPSASIDWGDGTTSMGTITANADGSFSASGSHTYAEEGSYRITISAQDTTGVTASATSTATVADAILGFDAVKVSAWAPKSYAAEVTFNDHDPNGTLSDYQAKINWGDGTTTTANIRLAPQGQIYIINGTHVYTKTGVYTVAVTVQDVGGSSATTTQAITIK